MKPDEAIIQLVRWANEERMDLFYQTADSYLKTLATGGKYYYNLKNTLNKRPLKMTLLDNMSRELKGLINYSSTENGHVFLSDETRELFDDIIKEHQNKDAFLIHNIPVRHRLLFHGSTGNGKTTIAKEFARMANLPLVEVNSDQLVDSHLGATSTNIHKVFNSIVEPCVLFWDEIDTIGVRRSTETSNSASHENDRMTNSFLVNFEKLSHDVVFIGATNRKDILDSAFIRRFDAVHEVMPPTNEEKAAFLSGLSKFHNIGDVDNVDLDSFTSFYQIKDYVVKQARNFILSKVATQIAKPELF